MKRFAAFMIPVIALGFGSAFVLVWSLAAGSSSVRAAGPVLYVASSGSDATDCTSSAAPCATVQYAVDRADSGAEIRVAMGTYADVSVRLGVTQVVFISETVAVRGGYATTNWSVAYPVTQPTTLDAQGQGRVVYISGDIAPTVEGLILTGGDAAGDCGLGADAGGGICVVSARATISNNRVFSNIASAGGGILLWSSPATLTHNTVGANIASAEGGGILAAAGSDAYLDTNIISGNVALAGGGLYVGGSDPVIERNRVLSNSASSGGGFYLYYSDASLDANVVASNTATVGGGVYLYYSDASLVNNVVVDNRANSQGSGLYVRNSVSGFPIQGWHMTIARNWAGDGSGVVVTDDGFGDTVILDLTNAIVADQALGVTATGGNEVNVDGVLWFNNSANTGGAGIISVAHEYSGTPAFAADGYHLTANSFALDKGVNAGVTSDIDGDPRPSDGGYDLGADEYLPTYTVYLPVVLRQSP